MKSAGFWLVHIPDIHLEVFLLFHVSIYCHQWTSFSATKKISNKFVCT